MKLALIICGKAIDADVTEVLEGLGLRSYTKLPDVIGQGKASGPHLASHIWPGTNSVILVVLEESRASLLHDALRPLKERFSQEGLKLYFLPVEEAL
jgi:hypothetical protein